MLSFFRPWIFQVILVFANTFSMFMILLCSRGMYICFCGAISVTIIWHLTVIIVRRCSIFNYWDVKLWLLINRLKFRTLIFWFLSMNHFSFFNNFRLVLGCLIHLLFIWSRWWIVNRFLLGNFLFLLYLSYWRFQIISFLLVEFDAVQYDSN